MKVCIKFFFTTLIKTHGELVFSVDPVQGKTKECEYDPDNGELS